jgi:capsular exopolysaccharide synthesis family protein
MVVNAPKSSYPEPEFGYGQLFGILLRRWTWVVSALSLTMAGAIYFLQQEEPTYLSTMQLIVEPNFDQDLRAQDFAGVADEQVNETDYATQLALMRSSQFIVDAVESLQNEYPDLDAEAIEEEFALSRVEANQEFTRIFEASYIDNDPIKTQRFLEALQAVYLQYNEEQQTQRLVRGLEHINSQLAKTRENLEKAQNELEQFRQNQNLLDPTLQGQDVVARLSQVQEEQRQLTAELRQIEQQNAALKEQVKLSPQNALVASRLSQSQRIQALLGALQETSLALADRQIIYTEEDPQVQVLVQQRDNQLAQLRQEIDVVAGQAASVQAPPDQNSAALSQLQLGQTDFALVTQLLESTVQLQSLNARLKTLTNQEAALRNDINRFPSLIAEYDRLQPAVEIERNTLEQLLQQREQLSSELARGGFVWEVVESPQRGKKIGPDPLKPIALGIVAGLFLGGALAFGREAMDQRVRTSADLKRQVPLPLLGLLPVDASRRGFPLRASPSPPYEIQLPSLHPELADSPLIQTVLSPAFRDALDLVANNLQLLPSEQPTRAISITSGLPGEGKTTLSLGLALSLARMSQQVLVVDADLRRSGIQHELGLDMETGLSTLLAGQRRKCRPHRLEFNGIHVDVLPAGPAPEDPISLLSSPRFSKLMQRCKEHYDLVIVDTPPVLGMADALKIGAVCDGTVLVARLDRVTQPILTEVVAVLDPIQVLGLVANGVKSPPNRYRNYGNSPRSIALSGS